MDALRQDLRFAIRQLRRSPGFAAVAVLTLALGIGANASVFGLVDALLFRPVPGVEAPDRLVELQTEYDDGPTTSSYMDFRDFRRGARSFAELAAFKPLPMDLGGPSGAERVQGLLVTAEYFSTLGVEPHVGRFFAPDEDDLPGGNPVAVLAHGLWERRHGADPGVVGRTVELNGRAFRVIGVTPPGFRGTTLTVDPAIYAPMSMQPHFMPAAGNLLDRRGWGGVLIVGRLAEGTPTGAAAEEVAAIGRRLVESHPRTNEGRRYTLESFIDARLPEELRGSVFGTSRALLVAVGLLLLAAFANVATLLLARAIRRRGDLAVRRALGAGRGRLLLQHLVEGGVLALLGGAAGLLLAAWSTVALSTAPLPVDLDLDLDVRLLAFTGVVVLVTGIGFGLVGTLFSARGRLWESLGEQGRSGGVGRRGRLMDGLVVAQLALALPVLVAAGLFVRTLINLHHTELGFRPQGVLAATLDPTHQGYGPEASRDYFRRVLERVRALPDVEAATTVSVLPGSGGDVTTLDLEGLPEEPEGGLRAGISLVGHDFFRATGIALLQGRAFGSEDREGSPPVFVVNQVAATRYRQLTGRDPLTLRIGFEGPSGPFFRIVGVVADTRWSSPREAPSPHVYALHAQAPPGDLGAEMAVLARTVGPPGAAAAAFREAVRAVDPDVPLVGLTTLPEVLSGTTSQERLGAIVIGASGLLALLLAAVGLYGVLAYSVSARTGELGLRMALGAVGVDLLRQVLSRGMRLVAVGLVLGLGATVVATRWLSGLLHEVSPADPVTLSAVAASLVLAGLLACWLPARRASRIEPLEALRHE